MSTNDPPTLANEIARFIGYTLGTIIGVLSGIASGVIELIRARSNDD